MFLQVAISLLILGVAVNAQIVDLPGCSSYAAAAEACRTTAGVNVTGANPFTYTHATTTFLYLATSELCGADAAKIKTMAGCIADAGRACGSTEIMTLLVTGSQVKAAIDEVCEHKDNYTPVCAALTTCVQTAMANNTAPAISASFADKKLYLCTTLPGFIDPCLGKASSFTGCGTKNKDVQVDAMAKLRPQACGGASSIIYTSVLLISSLLLSL